MKFYILSNKRGVWGGHLVWWQPDRHGYTTSIDAAGVYGQADADAIVAQSEPGDSQAIECGLVQKHAVSVPTDTRDGSQRVLRARDRDAIGAPLV